MTHPIDDEVLAGRPVPITLSGTHGDTGVGDPALRFIHITDTHISAERPLPPRHRPNSIHHPNDQAERLVATLNELPWQPDFVLHTGDVANGPEAEHHEVARCLLEQIRWPVFYIAGNHDSGEEVRKHRITTGCEDWRYRDLPGGKRALETASDRQALLWRRQGADPVWRERRNGYIDWTDDNSWAVGAPRMLSGTEGSENPRDRDVDVWDVGDCVLIAVDSERDPDSDTYSFEQIETMRKALERTEGPAIIAIHHPVNVLGSPWHDYNMRLQNGNTLHDALKPYAERIRGVFSGHSHESGSWVRDGVPYFGLQSSWYEHVSWPNATRWSKNRDARPCYAVCSVWPTQTHYRQYWA